MQRTVYEEIQNREWPFREIEIMSIQLKRLESGFYHPVKKINKWCRTYMKGPRLEFIVRKPLRSPPLPIVE